MEKSLLPTRKPHPRPLSILCSCQVEHLIRIAQQYKLIQTLQTCRCGNELVTLGQTVDLPCLPWLAEGPLEVGLRIGMNPRRGLDHLRRQQAVYCACCTQEGALSPVSVAYEGSDRVWIIPRHASCERFCLGGLGCFVRSEGYMRVSCPRRKK